VLLKHFDLITACLRIDTGAQTCDPAADDDDFSGCRSHGRPPVALLNGHVPPPNGHSLCLVPNASLRWIKVRSRKAAPRSSVSPRCEWRIGVMQRRYAHGPVGPHRRKAALIQRGAPRRAMECRLTEVSLRFLKFVRRGWTSPCVDISTIGSCRSHASIENRRRPWDGGGRATRARLPGLTCIVRPVSGLAGRCPAPR
jgi:hypothetical protein